MRCLATWPHDDCVQPPQRRELSTDINQPVDNQSTLMGRSPGPEAPNGQRGNAPLGAVLPVAAVVLGGTPVTCSSFWPARVTRSTPGDAPTAQHRYHTGPPCPY